MAREPQPERQTARDRSQSHYEYHFCHFNETPDPEKEARSGMAN